MRNSLRMILSTAAVLAALSLAACGSEDGGTATETPESPATSATPLTTPSTTAAVSESPSPTAGSGQDPTGAPADALIVLDKPAAGASVAGSFAVSGKANSPEANVPWSISNTAGTVVLEGYFTAEGWMDKLYPFSGSVDASSLPAGDYTFTVAVDDESDGEGDPAQKAAVPITLQ